MTTYFAQHALVAGGVRAGVRITVADGLIVAVEEAPAQAGDRVLRGLVLPGMANVHSHSFQRAMAGLAEWDAGGTDNFWTWREAMYRFAERLTPEQLGAITRFLFVEMLRAGYTSVGEFHYLHNKPGGEAYAPAEAMALSIADAATETGIALAMLPTLYVTGGADGRALSSRQRRFGKSVDDLLGLRESIRSHKGVTSTGLALHSLRAVPPHLMKEAIAGIEPGAPIHIHAAEQTGEIEETIHAFGARPVEFLLANFDVDRRWCLIHATHMNESETLALAGSGAVAGLCPSTEGNLGDGVFPLSAYLGAGGAISIGGDSHVAVDPAEELKMLEYSQRLTLHRRNVSASRAQPHTAARLWTDAARHGAQALGINAGEISVGKRADLVVIDPDHVSLAGRTGAQMLDSYVFIAGRDAVRDVFVGGRQVVADGRHAAGKEAAAAYADVVRHITQHGD
jgi:formimidoylglutamate deiminase